MTDTAPTQTVNDFLRHIHLGAEVYYVGQLCDAWHMATAGGDATTFHLVCHGEAWIHLPSHTKPIPMRAGNIAFFAHDAAHAISGLQHISANQASSMGRQVAFDEHAAGTGLLCGHLKLPEHIRRLLLASFPDFMLIHPEQSLVGKQMRSLIELMSEEAKLNDLGVTAVLDRFSDTLFLYVIRHVLHLEPKLSPLLAALSDENLRLAVMAFIENPAEAWTVERMAKLACQSCSTFTERFTQTIKMPPMEFVATWRMQLATGMLADERANMLDVALRCGYESEAAFRKAFKRIIGIPPRQSPELAPVCMSGRLDMNSNQPGMEANPLFPENAFQQGNSCPATSKIFENNLSLRNRTMTDFTFYTPENTTGHTKEILEGIRKGYGFVPNLFAYMAAAPTTVEAYLALNDLVSKTSLSPAQQQVALLAVSVENDCEFCTSCASCHWQDEGRERANLDLNCFSFRDRRCQRQNLGDFHANHREKARQAERSRDSVISWRGLYQATDP